MERDELDFKKEKSPVKKLKGFKIPKMQKIEKSPQFKIKTENDGGMFAKLSDSFEIENPANEELPKAIHKTIPKTLTMSQSF
jgi:hypothetical protein